MLEVIRIIVKNAQYVSVNFTFFLKKVKVVRINAENSHYSDFDLFCFGLFFVLICHCIVSFLSVCSSLSIDS